MKVTQGRHYYEDSAKQHISLSAHERGQSTYHGTVLLAIEKWITVEKRNNISDDELIFTYKFLRETKKWRKDNKRTYIRAV